MLQGSGYDGRRYRSAIRWRERRRLRFNGQYRSVARRICCARWVVGKGLPPAGQVSQNKLAQALDFGAEIVHVDGSFDLALDRLLHTTDDKLYFLNSINPFRLEGQKMAMFEMLEQLGWRSPDYLIVPGGNLGNTSAFGKAFHRVASRRLHRKDAAIRHGSGGGRESICANVAIRIFRS